MKTSSTRVAPTSSDYALGAADRSQADTKPSHTSEDVERFSAVEWPLRPATQGTPVQVQVVIQFKHWEVAKLAGKEILQWSGALEFYWIDPRLDGYPRSRGVPPDIWRPGVIGSKGFDLGEAEKGTKLPTFNGKRDDVDSQGGALSNGGLCLKADFKLGNGGFNLSDHLKRFKAFPYDSTRVDALVQTFSSSDANEDDEARARPKIELVLNRPNLAHRRKDGQYQHVDWLATRHSDDFALVCLGYAVGSNHVNVWGHPPRTRASICLSLQIARTPNFYEHKGIVPLYAVMVFGFLCYYALEPSDLPSRISVISALFLTVFGIQWISIERLPRLPFSTILDTVAQCAIGGLMFMLAGSCASYKLARPSVGSCGPDHCPGFDLDTARLVDWIVIAAAAVFIVVYAFLYGLLYRRWKTNAEVGWARPWTLGKALGNVRFAPHKNNAYRLYTTEAWADQHENKFMGEGSPVDTQIW